MLCAAAERSHGAEEASAQDALPAALVKGQNTGAASLARQGSANYTPAPFPELQPYTQAQMPSLDQQLQQQQQLARPAVASVPAIPASDFDKAACLKSWAALGSLVVQPLDEAAPQQPELLLLQPPSTALGPPCPGFQLQDQQSAYAAFDTAGWAIPSGAPAGSQGPGHPDGLQQAAGGYLHLPPQAAWVAAERGDLRGQSTLTGLGPEPLSCAELLRLPRQAPCRLGPQRSLLSKRAQHRQALAQHSMPVSGTLCPAGGGSMQTQTLDHQQVTVLVLNTAPGTLVDHPCSSVILLQASAATIAQQPHLLHMQSSYGAGLAPVYFLAV